MTDTVTSLLPRVAVVVLNWKDAGATRKCIDSLALQNYANIEVIVVNNSPKSPDLIVLQKSGKIRLVQNDRNLGFTGGVNIGIRAALAGNAHYIWLLNSDAVAAPGALAELVAAAEADPQIGLASPVICYADRTSGVEFFGGLVRAEPLQFGRTRTREEYERWRAELPHRIWLAGTALLIRRTLVEVIGLFDERFFAYWEDNDYSLRSSLAGFKSIISQNSIVYHRHTRLDVDHQWPPYYYHYMIRNYIFLLRKHGGLRANFRPLLWELFQAAQTVSRFAACPQIVRAIRAGVADGFCGKGGEYDPRRRLAAPLGCLLLGGVRLCACLSERRHALGLRPTTQDHPG